MACDLRRDGPETWRRIHGQSFWEGHGQPAGPLFLQPGENPTRPTEPARIRFEDVWPQAFDGSLARYRGRVVPFELARPGD